MLAFSTALVRRPKAKKTRLSETVARLEALEQRCVMVAGYVVTNLVSDQPGVAPITDPNLVNPWGIATSPTGGNFWVSDNATGVTTLYNGDVNGSPFQQNPTLPVVTIPGGAPTGQVFNGTTDFVIGSGANAGPALFIFASESGKITGWNPNVPPPAPSTQAQVEVVYNHAIFKGIAIANSDGANYIYAADFHNNRIVVFDTNFHGAHLAGSFVDPTIPKGFAPFNIAALNGKLYVTYAKQDADKEDDVTGPGRGFIDVFSTDGKLERRLVSRGVLDAPWGMAIAPDDFGRFSGALLVGNFGNGHINAFNPNTGRLLGTLRSPNLRPLEIEGLWGLTFGNGVTAGDTNALYFSAGPDDEAHGLFGKITVRRNDDGLAEAIDVAQGLLLKALPGGHGNEVAAAVDQVFSAANPAQPPSVTALPQSVAAPTPSARTRAAVQHAMVDLDPIIASINDA